MKAENYTPEPYLIKGDRLLKCDGKYALVYRAGNLPKGVSIILMYWAKDYRYKGNKGNWSNLHSIHLKPDEAALVAVAITKDFIHLNPDQAEELGKVIGVEFGGGQ